MCTDFASLCHTASVYLPAEQAFALEEDDDREEEMFAVVDRQQWNTRRAAEPPLSPELQQMWAMRCDRLLTVLTPLERRVPSRLRIRNIAHHSDLATIRGPNVLVVASWDTHKFVAPNRTHLSHSGRTGGSTGQMDHSDIMEDPHRETKYRPGPNPHWPVCHRFGPRFIINRHPRYSPGKFIYLHTLWGINH